MSIRQPGGDAWSCRNRGGRRERAGAVALFGLEGQGRERVDGRRPSLQTGALPPESRRFTAVLPPIFLSLPVALCTSSPSAALQRKAKGEPERMRDREMGEAERRPHLPSSAGERRRPRWRSVPPWRWLSVPRSRWFSVPRRLPPPWRRPVSFCTSPPGAWRCP